MPQGIQSSPFLYAKKEAPTISVNASSEKNALEPLPSSAKSIEVDQFIRTQPLVKFSGRKPGSTTIQADKEKSIQLKAERAPIEKRIKAKQRQIKPFEDTIQLRQEKRDKKVIATGTLAPVMAGATAGAKMGFAVDAASGGGTMGAGTLIGGITGGVVALFNAAPFTILAADAAADVIAPVNNKDIEPKLKPLVQNLHRLEQEIEPFDTELQEIEADLEKAKKTTSGLQETETIAKIAVDEKAFKSQHFHHVQNGRESVYQEVLVEGERIARLCSIIPGFRAAFNRITGKTLAPVDMLEENQTVLQHGTDSERAAALRRIYYLDKAKKQPPSISYADYAREPDHFPELALAALQILTQNPQMRDKDSKKFRIAIEHALASQNERVIKAGLDAVLATDFHSGTINYHLDRIINRAERFQNAQIRTKAIQAREARLGTTYRAFDPDASIDRLMHTVVGNAGLRGALEEAAIKYQAARTNYAGHKMPALKLYLNGEEGIGKTALVANLHQEFNQDSGKGLIPIKFGPRHPDSPPEGGLIDSSERLIERLRQAGPLQGKTVFFDEFQSIQTLPPEQQRELSETLKTLFHTERIASDGQHPFQTETGIDPRQAIFAVATNTDLSKLEGFKTGQQPGAAARSRIKGGAVEMDLDSDLTEHIPEFVQHFVPTRQFHQTNDAPWSDEIDITPAAQQKLIETLNEVADGEGRMSGRSLVTTTIGKIETAILKYDSAHKASPLAKTQGKVSQPIVLDLDDRERFVVRPKG